MKVFFDTSIYIAEALLGSAAQRMIVATHKARWRVFTSEYVLGEVMDVLVDDLGFTRRLARLAQIRILRRCKLVQPVSSAQVPADPDDSPILQAALSCGADYLVTNDRHLLALNPFEGLHIISMVAYHQQLEESALL